MGDIYTARVSYGGADRFDVTRKTGGPLGEIFAPSWALLAPVLAHRKAGTMTGDVWRVYCDGYRAEMRASYTAHRTAWDDLAARAEVTLVCYCAEVGRCHRLLLAKMVLAVAMRRGVAARYAGERAATALVAAGAGR